MASSEPVFAQIESIDEAASETGAATRSAKTKSLEKPVVVRFGADMQGLLDLASPRDRVWLDVMQSLKAAGRPVYAEIDQAGRITQFLQPLAQPVGDIREIARGDVQVDLLLSHAIHVLRRRHPRFKQLLARLREGQRSEKMVWVTETLDTHEILDVR